ncbi:MAG: sorbosone dehydrogenase family protein [Sinobacteraceae bacterium]|nr:sorbosone dehydrogenase family protein [Nevskiaceae bacterium]
MMKKSWPRWLKIFLGTAVGLAVIAVGYFVWLIFLGGIAISDRAMLWKMLREEGGETPSAELVARQLRVPEGFRIGVWAEDLPSARLMAGTATGDVLLTQPRGGRLLLLRADRDGDGRSDGRVVLLEGLDRPNGIDLHEGWLYLAEASRVVRVRFDATAGKLEGTPQPIIMGLTADGNHWRKSLRVGSDGKLYLGQGSTCNVCLEPDPRRATVMRFELDGSAGEIIATGTRNPYGLDWAPWDGAMYATENGRDLIGDDIPPDELNRIEPGRFYGWPYVHGRNIVDPEYGPGKATQIAAATPPAHEFRAHNAPLGIRFLRHPERGPQYSRTALVALHGSWNRTVPDGYAVVALDWDAAGGIRERPFVQGFRGESGLIGRPVDVLEAVDGSIYVSDDYAGVIYRITRSTPSPAT